MKHIIVFCVALSMLSCKKNNIEMTIAGRNHRYWLKKPHAEKSQVYYYLRQFGIRKCPKKLVISLLFCNFIVENQ